MFPFNGPSIDLFFCFTDFLPHHEVSAVPTKAASPQSEGRHTTHTTHNTQNQGNTSPDKTHNDKTNDKLQLLN